MNDRLLIDRAPRSERSIALSEKRSSNEHTWQIGGEGYPSEKPAERTGKRYSPSQGTDARPRLKPRRGTHDHAKRGNWGRSMERSLWRAARSRRRRARPMHMGASHTRRWRWSDKTLP